MPLLTIQLDETTAQHLEKYVAKEGKEPARFVAAAAQTDDKRSETAMEDRKKEGYF
jgi:hypothetical protein